MISSAWSIFNCLEGPDGSSRLSAAPYLTCKDDEWEISRIHAIVVLTVWGVLTPLLMGIALQTMRRQLRTAEFSRRFSLLTFGYKQGYVWWETTSMLKKFLVSGAIVLFRKHYLLQATLTLLILLLFLVLTVRLRPFFNPLISIIYIWGEVRTSSFAGGLLMESPHRFVQIMAYLLLAAGVPQLDRSFSETYWGFQILPWVVAIGLPAFLAVCLVIVTYELYRELTTGKGKQITKLVASLRKSGECRSSADVQRIHEVLRRIEVLKSFPYRMLSRLCRSCQLLELQSGESLFSEGDDADHFYVLIKGSLDILVKEQYPPHQLRCINVLNDAGSFGESALLKVPPVLSTSDPPHHVMIHAMCVAGGREAHGYYRMQDFCQDYLYPSGGFPADAAR